MLLFLPTLLPRLTLVLSLMRRTRVMETHRFLFEKIYSWYTLCVRIFVTFLLEKTSSELSLALKTYDVRRQLNLMFSLSIHGKNKYWEIYLTVLDFWTGKIFPKILYTSTCYEEA